MLVSCSGDVFIRPGQLRVVLVNIIISVPNPKTQAQSQKLEDTGVLVQTCELSFYGRKKEQVNSQVVGSLYTCFVQTTNLSFHLGAVSAQGHRHIRYVGTPTQAQRLVRAEPGKAFANPMCLACFSLRGDDSTVQKS